MKKNVKEKENLDLEATEKSQKEKQNCHHFWAIDVANGPASLGKCKYCGEKREFLNAFPSFNTLRKNTNPLALPKIPEVEIDKESES
jgi:hypothetical protein